MLSQKLTDPYIEFFQGDHKLTYDAVVESLSASEPCCRARDHLGFPDPCVRHVHAGTMLKLRTSLWLNNGKPRTYPQASIFMCMQDSLTPLAILEHVINVIIGC
jgi:hypothetical protein